MNIVTKKSKVSSAFDYTAMPHGRDSDEDMQDRRISKSQMNPQRACILLLKKRLCPNFPLWMKIATTNGQPTVIDDSLPCSKILEPHKRGGFRRQSIKPVSL